jgi:threonine/homoserine/homoserine lactone efflux protein
MNELFAIGFAAGLALAIPLGPIGIMMVNTAIDRGWRHGAAASLGAATVDTSYALATFLVGAAISSLLASYATLLSIIGATVLLFLGLQILVKNLRLVSSEGVLTAEAKSHGSSGKTYFTFVAATAINPPTAIYFLAISPSIGALANNQPFVGALFFALGVFVASVGWGQTLALLGTGLRRLSSGRVRASLGIVGAVLIIALAFGLAAKAL